MTDSHFDITAMLKDAKGVPLGTLFATGLASTNGLKGDF